jgi:LysM repeat protein
LYKYDAIALGKTVDEIQNVKQDSHTVVKGDTLYSLSRKYDLTVKELKEINGFTDNTISIGQKLYLTRL